jgi:anthranilate phosphoribosyltransferase
MVFHGDDGLDELTTADTSSVWVVHAGEVSQTVLDPAVLGIPLSKPGALRGGDAAHNAAVVHSVLAG